MGVALFSERLGGRRRGTITRGRVFSRSIFVDPGTPREADVGYYRGSVLKRYGSGGRT